MNTPAHIVCIGFRPLPPLVKNNKQAKIIVFQKMNSNIKKCIAVVALASVEGVKVSSFFCNCSRHEDGLETSRKGWMGWNPTPVASNSQNTMTPDENNIDERLLVVSGGLPAAISQEKDVDAEKEAHASFDRMRASVKVVKDENEKKWPWQRKSTTNEQESESNIPIQAEQQSEEEKVQTPSEEKFQQTESDARNIGDALIDAGHCTEAEIDDLLNQEIAVREKELPAAKPKQKKKRCTVS